MVPVYGALAEFERCLKSLFAHTTWSATRLVVVVDGDPNAPSDERMQQQAADYHANLVILRNPIRRGFVASVNRGMTFSDRDIVLLNSDTEVTPTWLDKLQHAAYSAPEIATVTPFSNNATICSLPRLFEPNALPTGYDPVSFGALVERVSMREYPRLPTGVGVCLYIKREVLNRIGLFDDRHFQLGYGEEAEFCMRAHAAGYVHVLDDATFIFHAGHRSFGTSRGRRVRRAERIMRRLHPNYRGLVARFIRENPLLGVGQRVMTALTPPRSTSGRGKRVLHLVHGWPPYSIAGTEVYARSLALRQAATREVVAYARIADPLLSQGDPLELLDHGVRVRLTVNNFSARNPLVRNGLHSPRLKRDFNRLLDEFKPHLLHVHHLAGHPADLLAGAARRGIPILYQIQDWYALCARSNLLDVRRQLCEGPRPLKCSACLPLTGIRPSSVWNPLLYVYRATVFRRALKLANAFVAGSSFVVESYRRLGYLQKGVEVHVLPYGVEIPKVTGLQEQRTSRAPIRFGFIGSIQPHKGLHIAVEAFRSINPERAVLEVWGDPSIDPAYTAELARPTLPPSVHMRGRFPESAKDEIFGAIDVLLVPSLGLESCGLVVREAMCRKVPAIVSRRGALAEVCESGYAEGFEPGDVEQLRSQIERVVERPERVKPWIERLPSVNSIDDHAREIDSIYESILARSTSLRSTALV